MFNSLSTLSNLDNLEYVSTIFPRTHFNFMNPMFSLYRIPGSTHELFRFGWILRERIGYVDYSGGSGNACSGCNCWINLSRDVLSQHSSTICIMRISWRDTPTEKITYLLATTLVPSQCIGFNNQLTSILHGNEFLCLDKATHANTGTGFISIRRSGKRPYWRVAGERFRLCLCPRNADPE